MIITDNFVLLAFPKTGSSYTTAILRDIHARRRLLGRVHPYEFQKWLFDRLNLRRPGYREQRIVKPAVPPYHKARRSRHGGYIDIPEADRGKTIVSVCRDPLSRYTSEYLFQTRNRKHLKPPGPMDELLAAFPDYPELSFEQYYEMRHQFDPVKRDSNIHLKMDIGSQSTRFIQMYFKNPTEVLNRIDREYIDSGAYGADMADVRFFHQESLSGEFNSFLREMGYSEKECLVAERFKPRNVAVREKSESASSFYSPELQARVLARDALLFKLFPEYLPGGVQQ